MDLDGMSYPEAAAAFGREVSPSNPSQGTPRTPAPEWTPKPSVLPGDTWQRVARRFIAECAANMTPGSTGMEYALSRHLTPEAIQAHGIGWNPRDRWEDRQSWGLDPETHPETGRPRKVWLPAGMVIPSRRKAGISAIKIRRAAWTPEDKFPKYAAVSGSAVLGMALGGQNKPVVALESELDALLVHQEAGDLAAVLALGSASARPDADADAWLRAAPALLLALDFDDAGMSAATWWWRQYPGAILWPVPDGKDVGDLPGLGISIRDWVEAGLDDDQGQVESEDDPAPVPCVPTAVPASNHGPAPALHRIPAAAWESYRIARLWLRANLPVLLNAGWTGKELFGIGRTAWPWGSWGAAWLRSWTTATPELGPGGAILFRFQEPSGEQRRLAARPARNWAKKES